MAKKKIEAAEIIIKTTDGGTFKYTGKEAEKLGKKLEKTGRQAQTTDRKMKGVTQQSSNATKEFSKMATMQGGIVQVYATIAAQVFALSAAFQFLKDAMETRNLIEGQLAFGAVTGVAYKTLTTNIQAATGGMLQFREAAQAAAIGTAGGLSAGQLTRLGAAAKNTSLALGRDLTDSFNRLVRGVTKAEPELLDELGIILRLEPALKNYAASIGKSVKDLNQFEKSQAVANEVLDQADSKFGMMSILMDDSAFALQQFQKTFDDLMNSVKKVIGDVAGAVLPFFTNNVMALVGAMALFLVPVLKSLLPDFKAMQQAKQQQADAHIWNMEQEIQKLDQLKAKQADLAKSQDKLKATAGPQLDAQADKLGISGGVRGKARMIKHYETQTTQLINGEIQKRTGALAAATPKEVAILKKKYLNMNKATATWTAKMKASYAGLQSSFQIMAHRMRAVWQGAMAAMTRVGQAFATTMNAAMRLMGWASILLLIYEGIKALHKWRVGVDEAREAEMAFFDEVESKYSNLRQEQDRMYAAQSRGFVGGDQYITQVGNALKTTDLPELIKQYSELQMMKPSPQDTEATNKWNAAMAGIINSAFGIQHVFYGLDKDKVIGNVVSSIFQQEKITDEAANSAIQYANVWSNAATNIEQAAERNKTLAKSIQEVTSSAGELKMGGHLQNVYTNLTAIREKPAMLKTVRAEQEDRLAQKKVHSDDAKEYLKNMEDTFKAEHGESFFNQIMGSQREFDNLPLVDQAWWASTRKDWLAAKKRAKDYYDDWVRVGEAIEKTNKDIATTVEQDTELTAQVKAIWEMQQNIIEFEEEKLAIKKAEIVQEGKFLSFNNTKTKNLKEDLKLRKSINEELNAANRVETETVAANIMGLDIKQAKLDVEQNDMETLLTKYSKEELNAIHRILNAEKEEDIAKAMVMLTREQVAENKILNDISWRAKENAYAEAILKKSIAYEEGKIALAQEKAVGHAEKRLQFLNKQDQEYAKADLLLTKAIQAEKDLTDYTAERVEYFYDDDGLLIGSQVLLNNAEKQADFENKKVQAIQDYLAAMQKITIEMYKQSAQARIDKLKDETSTGRTTAESRFGERGFMGYAAGAWGSAFGNSDYRKMRGEMGYADDESLIAGEKAKMVKAKKAEKFSEVFAGRDVEDVTADELKKFEDQLKVTGDELTQIVNDANDLPEALRKASIESKNFKIELELAESIENTLTEGFVSMFQALVDGTQSFSDAMKNLMKQVLADLAAAYLRAAALKMMMAMGLPGAGPAPARYGGVMSPSGKSFGYGGVAHGPESGYQATLHGTEAVVPLGNDRSIPVELSGGGGGNNVVVNISMNGQGQSQSQVSGDGLQGLGRSVGHLVQAHLQQEMRPGGLLNPQGQKGRG